MVAAWTPQGAPAIAPSGIIQCSTPLALALT